MSNLNTSSSQPSISPVILCGGSGTRLWPVSRKSFPKQFVPLIDGKSLLELTLERVSGFSGSVSCVASKDHRFLVGDAQENTQIFGPLILEPSARNTAAAMALAALKAQLEGRGNDLLLFCPADHHIPDSKAFQATVMLGVPSAQAGQFVTFGIVPTFPSSAYGYIEQGEQLQEGGFKVVRFIEKPSSAKAQELILGNKVLWNAGIFLVSANTLVAALQKEAPDILAACEGALENGEHSESDRGFAIAEPNPELFAACRAESIDYAVLEKSPGVSVIPFQGSWSDVGSWNAVAALTPADENHNRIHGQGRAHRSSNTYIHAPHRPVIALGVDNLLIIDTPDAVLIAHHDDVEYVKEVVRDLEDQDCAQAITHRKVARPWGWYDSIDMGKRFQVKRIGVKPGASLSLQKHHHRAEHWIVVKGTAEVTLGEKTFLLSENQSTYIPIGAIHRLKNPGRMELEMIEVQSGEYLGEDDIVRLEDIYGRIKPIV